MAPVTTSKGHERKPYQPMLIIGLVIAIGVAAFFAGIYATSMNSVSEQYIDEAIAKLELKLLQDRLPSEAPQEQPRPPIRPAGGNDPIIGSPDAPIEIIEYSDFQCPFCSRFYDQTLPQLIEEYIAPGKAKLAFRDFPLQNIHPNAAAAALAAECAKEQDKFKGMHDILFERQREWGSQPTVTALGLFSQYAVEIEAEQTAFDACIASQRHLSIIGDDLNEGSSYGVTGTPGFFVGNAQIGYVEIKGAQPYEVFKQIIDAQLGT
ncbi:MAG: DsbA family protein [Nitrosopumilus sp. B06]|nr:MAG: DsbA family protein [Nitrosopumilus sp. B06]